MNATLTCIAKVPNTLERGGGGSAISKKWQKFRCPSGAQVTELNRFKWGALCQIRKCVLTDLPSTLNGLRESTFFIRPLRLVESQLPNLTTLPRGPSCSSNSCSADMEGRIRANHCITNRKEYHVGGRLAAHTEQGTVLLAVSGRCGTIKELAAKSSCAIVMVKM